MEALDRVFRLINSYINCSYLSSSLVSNLSFKDAIKMLKFCRVGVLYFIFLLYVCFSASPVSAADPDPLQDFCVADLKSDVIVNGFVCKNPKGVSGEDFFFRGLATPGNTNNPVGSNVTQANVQKIPGLNTLGVSLARIDFAPGGTNPPHTHPRGTEILVVLEGTLFVGFIATDDKLFSHKLETGDVFVFPRGLVHFQLNVGHGNAVAISGFNSQLAGVQTIANSVFGSAPPIPDGVLTKAFRIDQKLVDLIRSKFGSSS